MSPKGYSFVREHFENKLPHPNSISVWYKGVDCRPGFTTEALNTLQLRVRENSPKTIYCSLEIDEMTIRKLVESILAIATSVVLSTRMMCHCCTFEEWIYVRYLPACDSTESRSVPHPRQQMPGD